MGIVELVASADAGFVAVAPLRHANSNTASVLRGRFTGSAELWEATIDAGGARCAKPGAGSWPSP
jgi:hypothetical protein